MNKFFYDSYAIIEYINGNPRYKKYFVENEGETWFKWGQEKYKQIGTAKFEAKVIDNKNLYGFGMEYCGGFNSRWGLDLNGASNLKRLNKKLRYHCMIRRDKKLL